MTVKYSPWGNHQFVDGNGDPASGWKIHTYQAGSATPLATYTDSTGATQQSNPIILDSLGMVTNGQIWLTEGQSYKFILKDASDVVKDTQDYISGVNDSSSATSQWQASLITPTYVSTTSFTLPGDQTTEFHVGRRLQFTTTAGTVYGTILTSAFSTLTTVTMTMDSGQTLDSGLSLVSVSILRADHIAVPYVLGQLINVQVFTASGTYTPTPGTRSVVVEAVGGGGSGGGAAATGAGQASAGGGGNAGAYGRARFTSSFSGVTVTIGAAGAASSAGGAGNAGGTTSFGALLSCPGGGGGAAGSALAAAGLSASGGSTGTGPSGANLVGSGGRAGWHGIVISTAQGLGGEGGSGPLGAGGHSPIASGGRSGSGYGSGSSGAGNLQSSSAQASLIAQPGIVIVYEFA